MKHASLETLKEMAIAHGATSPNPNKANALAWSTVENDVVAWSSATGSWRVPGKAAAITKMLAVSGFSAANRYGTQVSGGEAGVATGFGNLTFFRLRAPVTGTSVLRRRINATNGWQQVASAGGLNCNYFLSGGSAVAGVTVPFGPADVGRVHAYLTRITATPGNIETFYDTLQYANVALASYAPATAAAQTLGSDDGAAYPATVFDVIGELDFRGVPTVAQILAFLLALRANGDVPTSFAGATITHRWSVRDTLYGQTYVDGQAAPAAMVDTATGASIDVKSRVGALTLREIDLTVDGRKSYAAIGFGTSACLRASGSIRGAATGYTLVLDFAVDSTPTADGYIFSGYNAATTTGMAVYYTPNGVAFYVFGGPNTHIISIATLQLGKRYVLTITWNGSQWRCYVDSVLSVDTAGGFTRNTADPVYVGTPGAAVYQPDRAAVFALAGCDEALSQVEITAMQATWASTRKLAMPAGKVNTHVYDISLDTSAAPEAGVPAIILDRVGTDHFTRVGGVQVGSGNGLTGFTKDARIAPDTFAGSASGFVVEGLFVAGANAPGETIFATRSGNTGFEIIGFNNYYTFAIGNGSASTTFAGFTTTPGTLYHFGFRYDGTTASGYVNGTLVQSMAHAFSPSTAGFRIGHYDAAGNYPCTLSVLRGVTASLTVPTVAQLQASASAALAAGKLVGATGVQKRWSMVDDVVDAGGKVPALIKERVSGNAALSLPLTNVKLEVAPRVERPVAFDATPILRGFTPTATSHYQTVAALADIGVGPCWFYVVARQNDQNAPATQLLMASNPNGSAGITIFAGQAYVAAGVSGASGATFNSSGNATLAAADVGRIDVILGVYTGSAMLLYRKRAFAISSPASFTPGASTSPLYVGSENNAGPRICSSWTVFGGGAGIGVPTLAQYQSLYDWVVGEDGLAQPMPGIASAHVWRIPPLVEAPATVVDLGTTPNNLTRVNTPGDVPNYARAFAA